MTFNLFYKNKNIDTISEVIKKADPDVVAFQEITEAQGKALKAKLGTVYPFTSFTTPAKILGVASFSKLKIQESKQIPIAIGYSQLLKVKHSQKSFYLVNIHTESIDPLDIFGEGQNITGAYKRREELLLEIFAYLRKASIPFADTILVGDFNSTEGNRLYQTIKSTGFTDAYRAVNPILPTSFTFPNNLQGLFGRSNRAFPVLRLDYVYAGSGFRPISGQVVKNDTGSDHKPVVMSLGL